MMITTDAAGTVDEVVQRLTRELDARGIRIFATIDHAAGAREAGLELADEVVLIFGSPAVGTALMQYDAAAGLDLPLRMLVWEDGVRTRVGYHDPHELAGSYRLAAASGVLDKLAVLLKSLAASVARDG
ncbi:DUF302 domain-containing protein [Microbacterium candidum]|uniref:DUF302 domain-containing protein n=1 Tax=Microbacterium candidum TaxID=3041922 RepID=A0ABT7N167_9MICO|nr:DUF302 domain-containing protein [Microbacterium sp. ASV49]MDL9980455.1 DUF302 domain-containing protein [Microbacterium sp. ASV49]